MAVPLYSFTIPSLEDDIKLDCRIYEPKNTARIAHAGDVKGAVVAHPYAPLGGSYDDPVVSAVTETLVEQGTYVATFNFR
jgi:alpha/beta superfamily hydrolase